MKGTVTKVVSKAGSLQVPMMESNTSMTQIIVKRRRSTPNEYGHRTEKLKCPSQNPDNPI